MIIREYSYKSIIKMLNPEEADFAIGKDAAGNKIIVLKSSEEINQGVSSIRISFKQVSYGEHVIVNAIIKNTSGDFGKAFCNVVHYRKGKRVYYTDINGNVLNGGECQFYGHGFKDYQYRFIIPQGVDSIEVLIYCKNGGEIEIKNLEACILKSLPAVNSLGQGVKFVAHLGMTGYAPSNTMPAFHLAKRAGFRECVVNTNFTKDGHIVVLHDDTIEGSSNGSGVIHEMTLCEARRYDYGGFFNEVYKDSEIPLLDDVLKFMAKSGIRPVLRLSKHFTGENIPLLRKIYDMVLLNGLAGKITAKAFSKDVLSDLSNMAGDDFRYGYCTIGFTQEDADWLKGLGRDVYLDLSYLKGTDEHRKIARENGIPVEAWCVNDFETIIRLIEKGVTGFTTDYYALDGCMF